VNCRPHWGQVACFKAGLSFMAWRPYYFSIQVRLLHPAQPAALPLADDFAAVVLEVSVLAAGAGVFSPPLDPPSVELAAGVDGVADLSAAAALLYVGLR
jgi:hypothetical protein